MTWRCLVSSTWYKLYVPKLLTVRATSGLGVGNERSYHSSGHSGPSFGKGVVGLESRCVVLLYWARNGRIEYSPWVRGLEGSRDRSTYMYCDVLSRIEFVY